MRSEKQIDKLGLSTEAILAFIAVVDHEGFTNAAAATHRSQSRVSAHVAAIEARLGAPLFDRRSTPVTLTDEGRIFLGRARTAISELHTGIAEVAALRGELSGALPIGSFPSASAMILAPLIGTFAVEHPLVRVEIHEGASRWLEDALFQGEVELAIRSVVPRPNRQNLAHTAMFSEPLVVIATPQHPAVNAGELALSRLAEYDIITIGEPTYDRGVGHEYRRFLDTSGVESSRRMVVSQPTTLVSLVREGIGIGLLGLLAARMVGVGDLVSTTLPADQSRTVGLFWNESRTMSTVAQRFAEGLRTVRLPEGLTRMNS